MISLIVAIREGLTSYMYIQLMTVSSYTTAGLLHLAENTPLPSRPLLIGLIGRSVNLLGLTWVLEIFREMMELMRLMNLNFSIVTREIELLIGE